MVEHEPNSIAEIKMGLDHCSQATYKRIAVGTFECFFGKVSNQRAYVVFGDDVLVHCESSALVQCQVTVRVIIVAQKNEKS